MKNRFLAKLFYVGRDLDGRLIMNAQTANDDLFQIEITQNQLAGTVIDGVKLLFQHDALASSRTSSASAPKPTPGPGADANFSEAR